MAVSEIKKYRFLLEVYNLNIFIHFSYGRYLKNIVIFYNIFYRYLLFIMKIVS